MAALIVFAHGAGAPASHPWMRAWAERLSPCGTVVTFDYPFMRQGSKRPDRLPVLVAAHQEAITQASQQAPDQPLVLAGKSMGSRIGCHVAAGKQHPVRALVCFGYPLRSASSGKSRADVLAQVPVPILFVQGTRDPLCPLDELQALLPTLPVPHELEVINDGDHSLIVAKRTLNANHETQATVDARIAARVQSFITKHTAGKIDRG
ncbi:MAG: alpha/beta fold hydrolase [Deltaproteobacteria bacterium]|nr:alpha/beta fold hydrolase [Deltaproteobacteria bacterium]